MPFKEYAAELQRNLKTGHATEPSYYPALKSLLESLDSSVAALQNPKKTEHGSPDFRVVRKKTIDFPVGWIEAKLPGEDLDKIERTDQLKRYYHLPNLILTDFLDFRWYTDGKRRLQAALGELSDGKIKFDGEGQAQVEELIRGFLAHKTPPAKDSRELARRMAQLAHFIRDAILIAHEREAEGGILHNQMEAFKEALIPDLTPEQFADMYAQTIAYGLFAARCQPVTTGEKFTREHAAYLIPKTNPFLRKLFSVIAGPDLPDSILPYVYDLVALLRDTDIGAIMADFGKRTAKEDPVVHFYEDFLQAYDPKLRELRGVYYTPEPVVSYIVRSIDYILKNQFSKPLGLADKDVLILDPACGTGTFLYFVIRHIYDTLCANGQKGQWNSYVSENLLKRIFGFELLMAPYAVAHLKLGILLQDLGYKFESDERLGVYLTNTLEEAAKKSEIVFAQWVADEANAASEIKREKPIMVVLGNPPYSNFGRMNRGKWILDLLEEYKRDLDEKKLNLDDDFIKFLRFGQWRIERTGYGILGLITNSTYIDGITHRRMRRSLKETFTSIYVLNLHGEVGMSTPDGKEDRNVFDIQQGVAISLLLKDRTPREPTVFYSDLWGDRESKYRSLRVSDVGTTAWSRVRSSAPNFFFVPRTESFKEEYDSGLAVTDILPKYNSAVQTKKDSLTLHFEAKGLQSVLADMRQLDPEALREKYELGEDGRDWAVRWAKEDVGGTSGSVIIVQHKPFDFRYTYFTGNSKGFLAYPRADVTEQMTQPNIALATVRQISGVSDLCEAIVTRYQMTDRAMYSKHGTPYVFPLWLYPRSRVSLSKQLGMEGEGDRSIAKRLANIGTGVGVEIRKRVGLQVVALPRGDLESTLGPEDLLAYAYSLLYCPSYRQRYSEFLKIDFPRVPLTTDKRLFAALAEKGAELISLHLMESPALAKFITKYEQPGEHEVVKVRYAEPNAKAGIKAGRVYVNDAQYFEGVPQNVWEFHIGGYQVCEKWLKDRKGRRLSSDDIDHYQKIVVALNETIRIMREIDEIIPGWPLP